MSIARLIAACPPPRGTWVQQAHWAVPSIEAAYSVGAAARDLVPPDVPPDPSWDDDPDVGTGFDPALARVVAGLRPLLSPARARVEHSMGELAVNGVRHGGFPVQAQLSRGDGDWLIVVSDTATEQVPWLGTDEPGRRAGGLGIRLLVAMADTAGWYTDRRRKHVWAVIGDEPPPHLLAALAAGTRPGSR